jgi:hypothetical protein
MTTGMVTSDWPVIERDIRAALARAGHPPHAIDRMLSELAPVALAVERARMRIDAETVWALLGVCADRARRRAQHHHQSRSSMRCKS